MLFRQCPRSFSFALAGAVCVMLAGTRPARADIINVPDDYETIQEAIEAANPGDEVVVAEGEYFENIDFLGKAITVRSTDPEDPEVVAATIINGSATGPVVTCSSGEGSSTLLSGLTITNGLAENGGGLWIPHACPTIVHCVVCENEAAERGGGMYTEGDNPRVAFCEFSNNLAGASGGAMYIYFGRPFVQECTFDGNQALGCGGAHVYHSYTPGAVFFDCTFDGNSGRYGAGMLVENGDAILVGCTISNNLSGAVAGGMLLADAELISFDCTFQGNWCYAYGGAISAEAETTIMMVDCLVVGNLAGWGGGIQSWRSSPMLYNCTLSGNEAALAGGAMCNEMNTSAMLINSIVWGNSAPTGPQIHNNDSSAEVTYSCVEGGYEGAGNIDLAPLFTRDPDPGPDGHWGSEDDDYGDLHLTPGSPCIDAGDNTAVPEETETDLDGNPRFVNDPCTEDSGNGEPPIVDMGAYEFQPPCPCDLDCDGEVVTADLLFLLGAWGTPDGDVDADGHTDTADLLALLGAWGECP